MAVGRLGDVINGEHHGPPTSLPWGIRYTHPEALTPDPALAYHAGGLYEVLLALSVLVVVWPLASRLRRPGELLAAVVPAYAIGRLVMFWWRSDSPAAFLGLDTSEAISLLLVAAACGWLWTSARRHRPARAGPRDRQDDSGGAVAATSPPVPAADPTRRGAT